MVVFDKVKLVLILLAAASILPGKKLPLVKSVGAQPLKVQTERLEMALDYLGTPLSSNTRELLAAAWKKDKSKGRIIAVQEALDPYCLFYIIINAESRVIVEAGPAKPVLIENEWRQYLVKVENRAGVTARLRVESPQTESFKSHVKKVDPDRWLKLKMFEGRPLRAKLSGVGLEYRIIQIHSRDRGKKSSVIGFNVGQGSQDLGFRNDVMMTFDCLPTFPVTLKIFDEEGAPTTAGFIVRDPAGRTYPSQVGRIEPDFSFHPQVYRQSGEELRLPLGAFNIEVTRGPEYIKLNRAVKIESATRELRFDLRRWIDPSKWGWWSGDHHIHAAGCKHYKSPTEGVNPSAMIRHCIGEDLKIGATLTWGPGFDFQKQFFTAREDKVSRYPYLIRYDVEVSGFGSHKSGHLCLLRLKKQIPPGGGSSRHWPTLCLNTLRWAKKQGAIVGPAHSGWGLEVDTKELPNYIIPPFDGIGANEYIVDVTHRVEGPDGDLVPAVDFISTVDTPYVWELNIWYHTLNCGFRTRISGETDFPCIYGERVGLGRSYVKVDGKLTYDKWCEGIARGRNYVSDGRSHLMEFEMNGVSMGQNKSELRLEKPAFVIAKVKIAALLPRDPFELPAVPHRKYVKHRPSLAKLPYAMKPFWHLERSRIGRSREVNIELIINARPVARKKILADGILRPVVFEKIKIKKSSWIAVRVLGSSHSNPIFVLVGDKPIRASRKSGQWCLKSVDQCWSQKKKFIAKKEMDDAVAAYDHARKIYRRIISESESD